MAATHQPGRIPLGLQEFAQQAVGDLLKRQTGPKSVDIALGESLSEPKAGVWFEPGAGLQAGQGLRLHPRSRMVYDDHHIYINGESWRAAGADARLLRQLADHWQLDAQTLMSASVAARELLADWLASGWLMAY